MDTSSRTSVALVRVLCARLFRIAPTIESHAPDLDAMLERGDAALIIGDKALLAETNTVRRVASAPAVSGPGRGDIDGAGGKPDAVMKIDLGEAWTSLTGLPFVWAFWAGRDGAIGADDVAALQAARDAGVREPDAIARDYFRHNPQHRAIGAEYLRDNIKYYLGGSERAGLELFYRYAAEIGVVQTARDLQFYGQV
jgi:chorismate dehydratase